MNIPAVALEAGARAITMALIFAVEEDCRALALTDDERTELARAAFLAMIDEWPRMYRTDSTLFSPALILPLTENRDAET